jgi:hypothetical protein
LRFFTIDWWRGALDEEAAEAILPAYQKHFAAIRDRLPSAFQRIGEGVPPLHDARLLELDLGLRVRRAKLTFADYSMNQRFALVYDDVETFRATGHPQKGLGGPHGFGDLGYDEQDVVGDGLYEHRLLFSTGVELQIQFAGFAVEE